MSVSQLSTECWGEYTTIVFAVLFFVSEAMPFFRQKSKCHGDVEEKQGSPQGSPQGSEARPRRSSVLYEANGVVDTLFTLYIKRRKQ